MNASSKRKGPSWRGNTSLHVASNNISGFLSPSVVASRAWSLAEEDTEVLMIVSGSKKENMACAEREE